MVQATLNADSLARFWEATEAERHKAVLRGIQAAHSHHYARNNAYRNAVAARGVGPRAARGDLSRLLRPTSQTFKSYIELLGTPFPQDEPRGFGEWLADQLSVDLPRDRLYKLGSSYRSLEALLQAVEDLFSDLGLELLTSSGTSGRATIIARDRRSTDLNAESFHLSFQRYLGMKADHRAIFMMPKRSRIAMVRMARFSVVRVGLTAERVHFAIPFPAHPDQVRIRAGRAFRSGRRGFMEKRLWHPAINAIQARYVDPRAIRVALTLLERAARSGEKVLLLGSLAQLHGVALALVHANRTVLLAPGSLLGTGGGMKEAYDFSPEEIRRDLERAFHRADGGPLPLRDIYGMAEANWAAMQCSAGNYHIPPWVHTCILDEDGEIRSGPRLTGLLAFFDPFGGGDLFPGFFRTADRVTLAVGRGDTRCPCGDDGDYLEKDSIQRVDLLGEAGCAAQI